MRNGASRDNIKTVMKGFIFKNAYFDIEEYETQSQRIKQELNLLGVECDIVRNDYCSVWVDGEVKSIFDGYNFCVYLDKDKYALYAIEKLGIRTFNNFNAIEACDDKMTTFLQLSNNSIPMPKTIPGILCYTQSAEVEQSKAIKIEQQLGYPMIVKTCFGSRGNGVYLIEDRKQLLEKMQELKMTPHLFQQFIAESRGKDLRVIVIGGKVLGGMLRQSESDFRSNVALGGKATTFAVPQNVKDICEKCASVLGLDYCGIDVLLTNDNNAYICEVNSNAFFFGFEKATGLNVAKKYAEHIVGAMNCKK